MKAIALDKCPRWCPEYSPVKWFASVCRHSIDSGEASAFDATPGPNCPLPDVPETWVDVSDIPPEEIATDELRSIGGRLYAHNSAEWSTFVEKLRGMK